jgi:glc operon protein GlcG
MYKSTSIVFAVCCAWASAAAAQGMIIAAQPVPPQLPAQPQQPQPSAGGTPAQVPFNIPYGMPISLDAARKLLAVAEGDAKRRGWPMAVAVVDTHGELVAFARMDGTELDATTISQRKARIAARLRRETRIFFNLYEGGHTSTGTLDADVVASPGGFPLVEGGKVIGAIGCSGGTGDQDAVVCKTAVDALSNP